jgi:hypothetical protein
MSEMGPRELIKLAEAAASHPGADPAWCRAAALLARQALEAGLAGVWESRGVSLASCSFRSQLLCLPEYTADKRTARRVGLCWWALTLACHHQPYELAPSCEEVAGMLEQTKELVVKLERMAAGGRLGRSRQLDGKEAHG